MTTFAIISEGITDQAILENIIDCLTNGDGITRPLLPLRDETDKNRVAEKEFSNWELVFEYLASEKILDAIQTNDFIVVQVDTDQCEHPNFGINLLSDGEIKDIQQIVTECIATIKGKLHPQFPEEDICRILFAIPVLSSECWLVAAHDPTYVHHKKKINGCANRLQIVLGQKKPRFAYKKDYEAYSELSRYLRKRKNLNAAAKMTPCLQAFINQFQIGVH
jgi:hypothetical protein